MSEVRNLKVFLHAELVTKCLNCGDVREPIVSKRTKIEYCAGCLHAKNDPRRMLAGLVEVFEVCRTMMLTPWRSGDAS